MAKSDLKERAEEIELLVDLVKEGDHDAFSTLYGIFVDPLYRYIYFRVKKEDAEELIIFLEMLLKFIYEFPNRMKKKIISPETK